MYAIVNAWDSFVVGRAGTNHSQQCARKPRHGVGKPDKVTDVFNDYAIEEQHREHHKPKIVWF